MKDSWLIFPPKAHHLLLMNTQPTLSFDLLTHIGTFLNPNETWGNFIPYDERTCLAGVIRDKDLLQFYVERDGRENACTSIALAGNLAFLRWLQREGCRCCENTCAAAAARGHLEILQWLRSEGCPWDEYTCDAAAGSGHLDVLKWLRSEGCPWDDDTCWAAAKGGHLEVLKWLRSEGCPWDDYTCY